MALLYQEVTRDPFLLHAKAYIYSFRGTVPLIYGEEIFSVVMMTIGVSRSTIILRMAVRDHGDGMWAMAACCDCVRYPFFFFGAVFGTYLFATAVPLVAFAGSLHFFWLAWALFWTSRLQLLLNVGTLLLFGGILLWLCGKKWLQKRLFRLSGLVNEEAAMPTEKGGKNAILFTKEQFNAGLRFPLPALFKEFLHFSQIPPSSFIPTLSGC
ncbi:hypothetical protein CK203_077448 [Vitis vinifera]|uniref:Uncharacterized protein n=1 Tax=Vitis vinifera TaxID=29760 RepID=A0A438D229_VITVI|nr:hypothetical protein CK203_077448 [Vitis vinifera]